MTSSRQEELLPTTAQAAPAPASKARNWLYWVIPTAILVAAVVGITVGVVVGTSGSSSSSSAAVTAEGTPAAASASPPPSPASSTALLSPPPAAGSPAASGATGGGSAPVVSPSPSPSPSPAPVAVKSGFTAADVAAHSTPADCWYIYGTKVVDITQYIARDLHPGGNDIMFPCCGKDCTRDFDSEHRGQKAHREQATYYIGDFVAS